MAKEASTMAMMDSFFKALLILCITNYIRAFADALYIRAYKETLVAFCRHLPTAFASQQSFRRALAFQAVLHNHFGHLFLGEEVCGVRAAIAVDDGHKVGIYAKTRAFVAERVQHDMV